MGWPPAGNGRAEGACAKVCLPHTQAWKREAHLLPPIPGARSACGSAMTVPVLRTPKAPGFSGMM